MLYLEVDIGKNSHVGSMVDETNKIIFKGFSFTNTTDDGESLLLKLAAQPVNEIESVYSFLIEKGFSVHVINPILTDGWRKGTEIRKHKTGTIDSVLIAELIRYGSFVETHLSDAAAQPVPVQRLSCGFGFAR